MNTKSVKENAKDNQHHLTNLVNSNPKTINIIVKHGESFAVVYAVSSRDDDTIIYVGETSDIGRRMRDHLSGTSSFSKKLGISENELKWYQIRHRRMANERQRKLFESYAIGVLKPKSNF